MARYSPHTAPLRTALMQLRVYEQRWIDLSYPAGDPRAVIPDDEQPQYALDMRDQLRRNVVRLAALVAGATESEAAMFADTPTDEGNPYNVARVRLAASLHWPIPEIVLAAARKRLAAGAQGSIPALDPFQALIEGGV